MSFSLRAFAATIPMILLACGCGGQRFPGPPASPGQLQADRQRFAGGYPRHTVVLYNLQRALNPKLPAEARVAAVGVLASLGSPDRTALDQLAVVLSQDDAPEPVRKAVLEYLLQQDYPGLAAHVVGILPTLKPTSPLRKSVLDWLGRHGQPEVLAEVVRLWGRDPGGESHEQYRRIVEQLSRQNWQDALLTALNSEAFFARGSAIEILARHMTKPQLAQRIAAMPPRSEAVVAMQAFLKHFDYLPMTGEDLLAVAQLYVSRNGGMADASRLYRTWRARDGYEFQIGDFHLLAHLATDPLRKDLKRDQLLLDIGQATRTRPHVQYKPSERGRKVDSDFWSQSQRLSTVDLWTMYLLNEMLSNPANQAQLYLTAVDDNTDRRQVYGGLVRYMHGRAAAERVSTASRGGAIAYRYPNDRQARNDLVYVPDEQALRDSRDSLCWYFPQFEKMDNGQRAGPDPELLTAARQRAMRGLVLTSLSRDEFAAHYFTPRGDVVSLGVFPFRR